MHLEAPGLGGKSRERSGETDIVREATERARMVIGFRLPEFAREWGPVGRR